MVIRQNWFVVSPSGRVGLVSHVGMQQIEVQFGAGGPFEFYRKSELRVATSAEVKAAELDGVGGGVVAGEEYTIERTPPRRKISPTAGGIEPSKTPGRLRSRD